MEKLIFHIDVNSAYLSWESIYRMTELNEELDLRAVPSIVGGDREARHGIVLAKSIPARAYGIHTAETIVSALRKCPSLLIVPPRFELYNRCSADFIQILKDFSPDIEQVSIDEAFVDMTQTCHLFGTPMETAGLIKDRIYKELHFTVNIGVSINKLLAKMASDFEKPNLCHSLFPSEIREKMWPLPVGSLYFVGPSAQKKMKMLGIKTIGDLANYDRIVLQKHLGEKYGKLIYEYANGIADNAVIPQESINKGYGNSTTLSKDVTSYDTARQILLSLSETVGMRLRYDHVKCGSITVELKDADFRRFSHQMTLLLPTDITNVIYESACHLLREFWKGEPIRLLGIRAGKICSDSFEQMSLFPTDAEIRLAKQKKLDDAMDKIRMKYGADSIKRASILEKSMPKKHLHTPMNEKEH